MYAHVIVNRNRTSTVAKILTNGLRRFPAATVHTHYTLGIGFSVIPAAVRFASSRENLFIFLLWFSPSREIGRHDLSHGDGERCGSHVSYAHTFMYKSHTHGTQHTGRAGGIFTIRVTIFWFRRGEIRMRKKGARAG